MMFYENTRQCGRAGGSSSSRCRVFPGTEASARNRLAFRRQPFQCETLEAYVESGGRGRFSRQAASRPRAEAFRETETATCYNPCGGTCRRRISYRLVDLFASCGSDSQTVPYPAPPSTSFSYPARSRFQPAEATPSGSGAGHQGRRALAQTRVVAHQKKARRRGASIVFIDETGFRLQPVNRRTWAPTGRTPVQRVWDRYDRLSVIGAVTLSPGRRRIGTPFQIHDHNIRTGEVVDFIRNLRRQLQQPLIICLDRWSVHRSAAKKIAKSRHKHIDFEWLPAYAPELNPVEACWSYIKHAELANFVPDDTRQLKQAVRACLKKQVKRHRIKKSFFQTARLKT
jgi:putative transposase